MKDAKTAASLSPLFSHCTHCTCHHLLHTHINILMDVKYGNLMWYRDE